MAPSPKSQSHDVGVFVDVSVKFTVNGAAPDDADFVNEATGATGAAATVTDCEGDDDVPPAFVAVKTTLYGPPAVKVCDGFWVVTGGVPSPKFQLHEVGVFVEVSVKVTVNGAAPDDADFVNEATGAGGTAGLTVTGCAAAVSDPAEFVAFKVTLYVPGLAYMCDAVWVHQIQHQLAGWF